MRAADDFEEIRKNLRTNAVNEKRCTCRKNESGGVLETNDRCPAHGKWLGEMSKND